MSRCRCDLLGGGAATFSPHFCFSLFSPFLSPFLSPFYRLSISFSCPQSATESRFYISMVTFSLQRISIQEQRGFASTRGQVFVGLTLIAFQYPGSTFPRETSSVWIPMNNECIVIHIEQSRPYASAVGTTSWIQLVNTGKRLDA